MKLIAQATEGIYGRALINWSVTNRRNVLLRIPVPFSYAWRRSFSMQRVGWMPLDLLVFFNRYELKARLVPDPLRATDWKPEGDTTTRLGWVFSFKHPFWRS